MFTSFHADCCSLSGHSFVSLLPWDRVPCSGVTLEWGSVRLAGFKMTLTISSDCGPWKWASYKSNIHLGEPTVRKYSVRWKVFSLHLFGNISQRQCAWLFCCYVSREQFAGNSVICFLINIKLCNHSFFLNCARCVWLNQCQVCFLLSFYHQGNSVLNRVSLPSLPGSWACREKWQGDKVAI